MRISLLTVLVSPLTMRLNWEAETPIFSASSFCVMWFPLHKSEIRCPGVPGKAINTHLLRIFPLYRMIAKIQVSKCKLHQNAILAIFRGLHFFRVVLWYYFDRQNLENRINVRKSLPRLVEHRKTPY